MDGRYASKLQFAAPSISDDDIAAVVEVLKSGVISQGEKVLAFESDFANYVGVKHAIAVSSGTTGLHLAIVASGISDGDEVITTPLSFVPSSNCLLYERAKPVFVDIELDTLGPDPLAVEQAISEFTRGIIFIDLFHQPVNHLPLKTIAEKNDLIVIEDACETLGATTRGKPSGSLGDIGIFGFYPNKQITTGEGGMLVTDDDRIADIARSLRNQGRSLNDSWLSHSLIGYNYRMSEMNAALGMTQLSRVESFIERREAVAKLYKNSLKDIEGIGIPHISSYTTKTSWFAYVIQIDDSLDRNKVMERLEILGVPTRDYFNCIHLQKPYVEKYGFRRGQFPKAEYFSDHNFAIPFHMDMAEGEVQFVCEALKKAIQ